MKNKIQQRGFTLIELLVVIVILGILSTISVGTFRSYFAKARDSERVSTVQNIAMMIKVDSGGAGDCTVYNYGQNAGTDCATASLDPGLKNLLEDNDYSMPDEKNGLAYFYGVRLGSTSGDNDFFVVVGAEEDVPQNGKEILPTSGVYAFIDGTTKGIEALRTGVDAVVGGTPDGVDTCAWASDAPVCTTAADWLLYKIANDGTLIVWPIP